MIIRWVLKSGRPCLHQAFADDRAVDRLCVCCHRISFNFEPNRPKPRTSHLVDQQLMLRERFVHPGKVRSEVDVRFCLRSCCVRGVNTIKSHWAALGHVPVLAYILDPRFSDVLYSNKRFICVRYNVNKKKGMLSCCRRDSFEVFKGLCACAAAALRRKCN